MSKASSDSWFNIKLILPLIKKQIQAKLEGELTLY